MEAGPDLEAVPTGTHPASKVFDITVKLDLGKADQHEWNGSLMLELSSKPLDSQFLQWSLPSVL